MDILVEFQKEKNIADRGDAHLAHKHAIRKERTIYSS